MGHGVSVVCKNCADEKEYLFGVGMTPPSIPKFISDLNGSNREKAERISEEHKIISGKLEGRLYYALSVTLCTCLEYDGGVFESEFHCDECQTLLVETDKTKPENFACKLCGKQALIIEANMVWD